MEEDEGTRRTLLGVANWSDDDGFILRSVLQASSLGTKRSSLFLLFPVLSCTALLGKMIEDIEINLPRFDQCIR